MHCHFQDAFDLCVDHSCAACKAAGEGGASFDACHCEAGSGTISGVVNQEADLMHRAKRRRVDWQNALKTLRERDFDATEFGTVIKALTHDKQRFRKAIRGVDTEDIFPFIEEGVRNGALVVDADDDSDETDVEPE